MPSARKVLWIVVFCGFAVNYINRINVNIAVVSMVQPPKYESNKTSFCTVALNNSLRDSGEKAEWRFDWDEKQQNHVLGGFYWLHWTLQIPGGILARTWGTKLVFGLSNFLCSLLLFLMPLSAYVDYRLLVTLRVLQGFISGVAWPSMHNMAAQWIPPNERSKFISAYFGSSVGVAVTYPLCGFLMDYFGWESVFYVTGMIGVIWYISWLFFAFDSPAKHPRISESERKYIEKSLGNSYEKEKLPVPWKAILKSRPVWMSVIAQWGATWGLFTLMTQSPTYFSNIIGLDVTLTGIYSGIPHLFRSLFAILFASFCDYLLTKGLISCTNVRKFATLISIVGQGLMFIVLAYTGCNGTAAVIIFMIAIGIHGAVSTGPLAALVDISPNFAGITQGIAGTIGCTSGTISAFIVGLLTYQNQTLEQWQKVYFISAAIMITCGGIYIAFSKSDIQDWNTSRNKEPRETVPLK